MKTRFFTLATLALALAACNNDNENLNGDPVAAQFTAQKPVTVSGCHLKGLGRHIQGSHMTVSAHERQADGNAPGTGAHVQ